MSAIIAVAWGILLLNFVSASQVKFGGGSDNGRAGAEPLQVVTLAVNNEPIHRIMALHQSLIQATFATGTPFALRVMCTPAVSRAARLLFSRLGLGIIDLPPSPRHKNYRPAHEKWADLLSKLELWRIPSAPGKKIIYADADVMFFRDPSWLLDVPSDGLVAERDEYMCQSVPRYYFNSGLMVLTPDDFVYRTMWRLLDEIGPVTNGDQAIVNLFFIPVTRNYADYLPSDVVAMVPFMCDCDKAPYRYDNLTAMHCTGFSYDLQLSPNALPDNNKLMRIAKCRDHCASIWRAFYWTAVRRLRTSLEPNDRRVLGGLFSFGEMGDVEYNYSSIKYYW